MAVLIGLAYVLLPFDVIPDVFGPFGVIDDVAVLAFLYTKLRKSKAASAGKADDWEHYEAPRGQEEIAEKAWEILGVSEDASLDELKLAYRKKLAEYHPDKVNHLGEDLRRLAHEKTLKIKEAYTSLERIRTK
jgi:DnaJ-domain-containing protein 1